MEVALCGAWARRALTLAVAWSAVAPTVARAQITGSVVFPATETFGARTAQPATPFGAQSLGVYYPGTGASAIVPRTTGQAWTYPLILKATSTTAASYYYSLDQSAARTLAPAGIVFVTPAPGTNAVCAPTSLIKWSAAQALAIGVTTDMTMSVTTTTYQNATLSMYRDATGCADPLQATLPLGLTFDETPPTGGVTQIAGLSGAAGDTVITSATSWVVTWAGADGVSGSGVRRFWVARRLNAGAWGTATESALLTQNDAAAAGNVVCYRVEPEDNVGWRVAKTAADLCVKVVARPVITASATPVAGGTVSGAGTFDYGQSVSVIATPNAGYRFVNWAEGPTSVATTATYTFAATANRTLVANFEALCTITASAGAGGTAAVTAGGASGTCGRSVTVTATPNAGFGFTNWTDGVTVASTTNPYTFALAANRTLTANFAAQCTLAITAGAGGTVALDSGALSGPCGRVVIVSAAPDSTHTFTKWTNGVADYSVANPLRVTLAANLSLAAAFAVRPPPAAALRIITAPTAGFSGDTLAPPSVIELRDAGNLPVLQAGVTMTASKATGSGVLSGTLTAVTDSTGRATFRALILTGAGAHTLRFSAVGLTAATSGAITISNAPATALQFVVQPTSAYSRGVATPFPVLELRDARDRPVLQAGVTVTASKASGPGTISGLLTATTDSLGRATFPNLIITGAGNYTLTFASAGLTDVTSGTVVVSTAPASLLGIVSLATTAVTGQSLAPATVVELRNVDGQSVPQQGFLVTVSKATGPGTLTGTLTATTDAQGRATFPTLTLTGAGAYTLRFSAVSIEILTSPTITITNPVASSVRIVSQATSGVSGSVLTPATVVELRDAQDRAVAIAGAVITATVATGSGTLSGSINAVTDSLGRASFPNLIVTGTGAHTLTFASPGLTSATSTAIAISPAPATALAIISHPVSGVSTSPLTPAVTVELRNALNQAVLQAGVTVTASRTVGPGTLTGTLTAVTDAQGRASFANLVLTGAGTYTLTYASVGLTSVTSAAITVTDPPATALQIVVQPTAGTSGFPVAPSPVIELRDAQNRPVLRSGVVVTASKATGPGTIGGTLTATTNAQGRATFTAITLTGAGQYTLNFAAPGLTGVTSTSVTVSNEPATALAFITQPATGVSGSALLPVPTIELRSASNQPVVQPGIVVTVTKATGPGTLSGTLTATTDAQGRATFPNIIATGVGAYTLAFASPGLTGLTSGTVTVTAPAATRIVIASQPSAAVSGTVIAPPFVVQLRDATGGNVLQSGVSVTAAVSTGTGTLSGTTTVSTDAAGRATFSDLVIDGSGAHTLAFSGVGLASAVSTAVAVRNALVITTGASLPNATVGVAYTTTLTAAGGVGSYVWAIEAGTLPTGLQLNANGVLDGVPRTGGTSTVAVRVTSGTEQAVAALGITVDGWGVVRIAISGGAGIVKRVDTDATVCSSPGADRVVCDVSFGAAPRLTAVPTAASGFVAWAGPCTGRAVCQLATLPTDTLQATFVVMPTILASAAASDLLRGTGLSVEQRTQLDQVGNADGVYNLGDLLALLDRTGQTLTAKEMSEVMSAPAALFRVLDPTATPRSQPTRVVRP